MGHIEFPVMTLSLTNVLTTFLKNDILRPFLRRFMLVFFYYILIYSAA